MLLLLIVPNDRMFLEDNLGAVAGSGSNVPINAVVVDCSDR